MWYPANTRIRRCQVAHHVLVGPQTNLGGDRSTQIGFLNLKHFHVAQHANFCWEASVEIGHAQAKGLYWGSEDGGLMK